MTPSQETIKSMANIVKNTDSGKKYLESKLFCLIDKLYTLTHLAIYSFSDNANVQLHLCTSIITMTCAVAFIMKDHMMDEIAERVAEKAVKKVVDRVIEQISETISAKIVNLQLNCGISPASHSQLSARLSSYQST